jgi:GTPase
MFHDRARIQVQAGRGGDGSVSFRREKYVPRGGPDGGDGGRGGDVVLLADTRRRDLTGFRPNQRFRAGRGGHGSGARRHGADGSDVELHVPVGTQVLDEGVLVADLAHPGARVVAARGGGGGRGNARFATPTRRAPRFAETGLPGDEAVLDLRLKLLADAALVGFPNAGKSSLLRRISNARPKVADYPFTTLAPVLGTVESPGGEQLTVADVPGLLEGASEGVGLGHEFLAHLERARLLVHVIDASEGEPVERFRAIDRELDEYGAGLADRPQIVVLNKIDLVEEPPSFALDDPRVLRVLLVSAATGAGVEDLKHALFELCPAAPEPPAADERGPGEEELADFLVYRPAGRARPAYRILRTDRGYRVHGTPPASEEELEEALRAAGAKRGALVEVGDEVIEL